MTSSHRVLLAALCPLLLAGCVQLQVAPKRATVRAGERLPLEITTLNVDGDPVDVRTNLTIAPAGFGTLEKNGKDYVFVAGTKTVDQQTFFLGVLVVDSIHNRADQRPVVASARHPRSAAHTLQSILCIWQT